LELKEATKMVVFQAGNEEYAISVDYVVSIEKLENINSIPHLPAYLRGIVQNRGELIPVIDFEYVLYSRFIEKLPESRLIVLQVESFFFGILVKEAKEIIDIPLESQKQVGLMAYKGTRYFSAVAKIENRLISVVDPKILVESLEGIQEIQEYMKTLEHA
jgi:purine-binding chemotaxis protein CheW